MYRLTCDGSQQPPCAFKNPFVYLCDEYKRQIISLQLQLGVFPLNSPFSIPYFTLSYARYCDLGYPERLTNDRYGLFVIKRLDFMMLKKIQGKLVPQLVVLLTISLPFLHHDFSRRYNYQIALVELLIIIAAILVYKRDFFASLPTGSFEFKLIIGFLISALISTLISPKIGMATHRYLSIIIWLTYLWLMVYLIQEKHLNPRTLIIAGAISCLLPIAVFFISYWMSDTDQSLMATFQRLNYYSNIRHFGYHLTASCLLSFYFILNSSFNWKKLSVGLALIIINFSILLITGSRQGILVTTLVLVTLLTLYYRRHCGKISVLLLAGTAMLVTMVYFNGGESLLLHLYERSSLEGLTSNRTEIWLTSLKRIGENWPLGFGPEAFIALRKSMDIETFVHPHSIFVQSLMEWGVIGSLIYFSILYRSLSTAFGNIDFKNLPSMNPVVVIAFFTLCGLLANSLIDGIFYHVLPIYFASIAFAILCAKNCDINSQIE